MPVKDYLHKYQDRFNTEHLEKTYSGTRGTFEEHEGLPAAHARKRTLFSGPITVAGGAVVLPLTALQTAYLTLIQCTVNDVAAANWQIDVTDTATGTVLATFTGAAIAWSLNQGDASGVIATATTSITLTPVAGGAGTAFVVITYYEEPTL